MYVRGWCSKHYSSWWYYGDPLKAKKPEPRGSSCSIPECSKKVQARGWCHTHYKRWEMQGDPTFVTIPTRKPCSVKGCLKLSIARSLCSKHYQAAEYEKTKTDPVTFLSRSYQRARSRTLGHGNAITKQYYKFDPICSREEWINTFKVDPDFLRCYRQWQLSGFKSAMFPVPDHDTDNGLGYTIRNIEWVTTYENNSRAAKKANEKRAA